MIWRVRDHATFAAFRHSRRRRSGPLSVAYLAGEATTPPRVAYAVGRRFGSAVERNRIRRRLRAVVAASASRMRPGAYLISVAPGAASLSTSQLTAALHAALPPLSGGASR